MTAVDNNLIDDLKWRGLISQTTDEAAAKLSEAHLLLLLKKS